jgi:hypothetical protein
MRKRGNTSATTYITASGDYRSHYHDAIARHCNTHPADDYTHSNGWCNADAIGGEFVVVKFIVARGGGSNGNT